MKIRKYQLAGNIIVQDNTRVQRPLITTPIKRKLKSDEFFYNDHGTMRIGKYKNEQVSSDVRTEKQRKSDQSWADKKKKQMRMQQAQEQTARVANSIIEKTLPSYWVEKATGEDLGMVGRLAADLVAPSATIKGLQLLGKSAKYVGKGIDYLARMDMARYGYKPTTRYYFKPGYLGVNSSPIGKVPEVPEGYTFIKEVELSGRNGKRKVHLVKDNSTGKTKILEDITFKSDLDWSKNWFEAAGRKYKDGSLTEYNDRDIKRLESHIPEYIEIEKKAKADGTWLKMPDGSTWEGDPRSWVQYKSEAVQKQNPEIFATGIHKEIDPNYNEQLWGLPFINQSKLALARARTYVDKDSKVFPMFTKKQNTEQSYTFDAKGSYWQAIKDKNGGYKTTDDIVDQNSKKKLVKIDNVIDIGDHKVPADSKYYYEGIGNNEQIPQNDIIIQPNVFRKSLIGNNGDFKHPTNMFRGLIPLSILGLGYSMSNE